MICPIDKERKPGISRQRRWQLKQNKLGNCLTCGKKRGKYKTYCNSCAKKHLVIQTKYVVREAIKGSKQLAIGNKAV